MIPPVVLLLSSKHDRMQSYSVEAPLLKLGWHTTQRMSLCKDVARRVSMVGWKRRSRGRMWLYTGGKKEPVKTPGDAVSDLNNHQDPILSSKTITTSY